MRKDLPEQLSEIKLIKSNLKKFLMNYRFAIKEVETKIDRLKEEFEYDHAYNPIERVSSRIKSPAGILRKVNSRGIEFSLEAIRENLHDIAGVRITCSFIADVYEISRMLLMQRDIRVVDYKDYMKLPKKNGYRSLHLIIQIPVFTSDDVEYVNVEVQIRTITMDSWASLEYKIYNRYNKEVPTHIANELREAASAAALLDTKMEKLRQEMDDAKEDEEVDEELLNLWVSNGELDLPNAIFRMGGEAQKGRN